MDLHTLAEDIRTWALDLGFDEIGITDVDLAAVSREYRQWLNHRFHGEMHYMERNVDKRIAPAELVPGTVRIVSARMNYAPPSAPHALQNPALAYVSRYATGRDYHKVLRRRLAKIATKMRHAAGGSHRAFVDSAPVLEKPIAEKAGLGWIGKHTLAMHPEVGSYFFLGEIFTDLPLPTTDRRIEPQCGSCKACINVCPTNAIVGPGRLDARKCISYLTIELKGSIPEELRPLIGNRVFGCDDCQLICPWNRFAPETQEPDFAVRHKLDHRSIADLLEWNEQQFLENTAGMALRRINYSQWTRNLSVAAGNAPPDKALVQILVRKREEMVDRADEMCVEHIDWAIRRLSGIREQRTCSDTASTQQ